MKRNKKRFAAQELLVLLAQLAHNLVIWCRNALAAGDYRFRGWGIRRMLRDVFHIVGQAVLNDHQQGMRSGGESGSTLRLVSG